MDITKPLSNLNPVAIFAARWLNRYVKLFLLVIIWLHSGCSKPTESSIPIINVPKNISGEILLSDIAKSKKIIHLETSENAFLGSVFDVKLFNERLYIADRSKILIFDIQGNFLNTLGKRGEGPGEYRGILSYTIDSNTGNVYVATDNRILVYSADSKLFMERKFLHGTYYISCNERNLYITQNSIGNVVEGGFATYTTLLKLTSQLEFSDSIPVKTVILKENYVGGFSYKNYLSTNRFGTYIYYPVLTPENLLRDTLYQIAGNKLIPSIKLQFEKKLSLNKEGFKNINIYNVANSSSYLICEYDQDLERRSFIYNKKTSTGYTLKTGLLDDQGEPVVLRPLDLDRDMFFYIKTTEYSNIDKEEPNPKIGIVELK